MRARDPHDDSPAKRRPARYSGPPVTLGHIRSQWGPAFADLLLGGALLPSQRSHQRRSLRAPGPESEGGMYQMRMIGADVRPNWSEGPLECDGARWG
jgi:hypothetical protein